MASLSMLAHSKAVAPPGRSERAEIQLGSMPVMCCSAVAECRRALVMNSGLVSNHFWRFVL